MPSPLAGSWSLASLQVAGSSTVPSPVLVLPSPVLVPSVSPPGEEPSLSSVPPSSVLEDDVSGAGSSALDVFAASVVSSEPVDPGASAPSREVGEKQDASKQRATGARSESIRGLRHAKTESRTDRSIDRGSG